MTEVLETSRIVPDGIPSKYALFSPSIFSPCPRSTEVPWPVMGASLKPLLRFSEPSVHLLESELWPLVCEASVAHGLRDLSVFLCSEAFPRARLSRPANSSSVFLLNAAEGRGSPGGAGGGGGEVGRSHVFRIPFIKGAFTS